MQRYYYKVTWKFRTVHVTATNYTEAVKKAAEMWGQDYTEIYRECLAEEKFAWITINR